jgi:membrane-associated phospholipid phosphatase
LRHNSSASRHWLVVGLAVFCSLATSRIAIVAILLSLAIAAVVFTPGARAEDLRPFSSGAVDGSPRPEHMSSDRLWMDAADGSPYTRSASFDYLRLGIVGHAVGFASRLSRDFIVQFQFPFRYAAKEPMKFTLGAAGLLALVFTDHWTQPALAPQSALRESGLMTSAEQISGAATQPAILAIVAGFGAFGIAVNSPRERETSVMLVEAVFTSEIWTDVLKMATRRERPREVDGTVSDWAGPSVLFESDDPNAAGFKSFPSGHSTGMWAVATILAHQYPSHGVVPVLSYGTALAMSYSRMAVRAHWLSDVVVGGLIGYGCARQVLSAHRAERTAEQATGLRVGIDASSDYMGVGLAYDF